VAMSDIVPHLGRYCEVTARNRHFFGELVRLSAVLLLVRPRLPASVPLQQLDVSEISEIMDLPDPHL
jgi:hypothetical protein